LPARKVRKNRIKGTHLKLWDFKDQGRGLKKEGVVVGKGFVIKKDYVVKEGFLIGNFLIHHGFVKGKEPSFGGKQLLKEKEILGGIGFFGRRGRFLKRLRAKGGDENKQEKKGKTGCFPGRSHNILLLFSKI
jgi:hypothetical protein